MISGKFYVIVCYLISNSWNGLIECSAKTDFYPSENSGSVFRIWQTQKNSVSLSLTLRLTSCLSVNGVLLRWLCCVIESSIRFRFGFLVFGFSCVGVQLGLPGLTAVEL
jgi:hypothetical protein